MPEQTGQDSKTIDLVVKATAIALSVLYIFGYLVVSLRLAEFGIHSVALLRIQYLTAGFFSLGPLFLIYFFSPWPTPALKAFSLKKPASGRRQLPFGSEFVGFVLPCYG